jgi:hypothetical protein
MVDSLRTIEGRQKVRRHSGVSPENVPVILVVVLDDPEPVFALRLVALLILVRLVERISLDAPPPMVYDSPSQLLCGDVPKKVVLAILEIEANSTLESVAPIEMEWWPAGNLGLWLLFLLLLWLGPRCWLLLLVAHDQARSRLADRLVC